MEHVAAVVTRGGTPESWHRASIAAVDGEGKTVGGFGPTGLVSFLRSAAKPFQAAAVVESGAADAFGLTDEDLALVAGSHNGEQVHVEGVLQLMGRVGVGPEALQCGRHAPFHKPTARRLAGTHTVLHHNCSGKHAGMLAMARHAGASLEDYLKPDHPVQKAILGLLADAAGVPPSEVTVAVDGCGAPTFAMPVEAAARATARLMAADASGGPRQAALARVRKAMMAHPELVAGDDRLDTRVMRAAPDRLLVKAGAEAFYVVGLADPLLGIAVKVHDGEARAMGPVIARVLERFAPGLLSGVEELEDLVSPVLRNHAKVAVGTVEAVFDWDF